MEAKRSRIKSSRREVILPGYVNRSDGNKKVKFRSRYKSTPYYPNTNYSARFCDDVVDEDGGQAAEKGNPKQDADDGDEESHDGVPLTNLRGPQTTRRSDADVHSTSSGPSRKTSRDLKADEWQTIGTTKEGGSQRQLSHFHGKQGETSEEKVKKKDSVRKESVSRQASDSIKNTNKGKQVKDDLSTITTVTLEKDSSSQEGTELKRRSSGGSKEQLQDSKSQEKLPESEVEQVERPPSRRQSVDASMQEQSGGEQDKAPEASAAPLPEAKSVPSDSKTDIVQTQDSTSQEKPVEENLTQIASTTAIAKDSSIHKDLIPTTISASRENVLEGDVKPIGPTTSKTKGAVTVGSGSNLARPQASASRERAIEGNVTKVDSTTAPVKSILSRSDKDLAQKKSSTGKSVESLPHSPGVTQSDLKVSEKKKEASRRGSVGSQELIDMLKKADSSHKSVRIKHGPPDEIEHRKSLESVSKVISEAFVDAVVVGEEIERRMSGDLQDVVQNLAMDDHGDEATSPESVVMGDDGVYRKVKVDPMVTVSEAGAPGSDDDSPRRGTTFRRVERDATGRNVQRGFSLRVHRGSVPNTKQPPMRFKPRKSLAAQFGSLSKRTSKDEKAFPRRPTFNLGSTFNIIPYEGYKPMKPGANRYLSKLADERLYRHHVNNVMTAKSVIDNKAPATYKHLVFNLNKIYNDRHRHSLIEQENRTMVCRIAYAMSKRGMIDNYNIEFEKNISDTRKAKEKVNLEFIRLAMDNISIMERIKAKGPSLETSDWREHWKYHQQMLESMRKFPSKWSG